LKEIAGMGEIVGIVWELENNRFQNGGKRLYSVSRFTCSQTWNTS